jgi:YhcH/YjgK/YiaL family protein
MIVDNIHHYDRYTLINPLFQTAFNYLTNTDLAKLEDGKHVIEGDDLFVILQTYESKDPVDCKMESHRQYIDIQYIIAGEELIGTSILNGQVPIVPYVEAKDVVFYKSEYDSGIKLQQGEFAIFFPHDVHMPCMKVEKGIQVRKAVFKIKVSRS